MSENTMRSLTAVRVNRRGEMTGTAEVHVWRQGGAVYLKVGRQRVSMAPAEFAALAGPVLEAEHE